jgi:hypothetical protein
MFTRPTCADCRCLAPQTNTYYTLIGPTHGWRMTRTAAGDGTLLIDWRCPPCWRKYKAAAAAAGTYPSSGHIPASRAVTGTTVPPGAGPPNKSSR